MRLSPVFVAAAIATGASAAILGPFSNLYIGAKDIAPNGVTRKASLAGASLGTLEHPGPLIRGIKNTPFMVNVHNKLNEPTLHKSTAIHWHGMLQHGTAWADGAAGVTQCPIAPDDSFMYMFQAKNQAGTYWYHSHQLSQYCDGLRGPMIVYDPFDPHRHLYDVDNEHTIISLADWYDLPTPPFGGQAPPPEPQSTLINGRGRSPGGPTVPLSIVHVRRFKRYRLRLISMACLVFWDFSIDGHSFTIIEADGVETQPLTVDSIRIFAGQRYSIVLNANRPVANYWIRSNPNHGPVGFAGGINSAILRYAGAPNADPTTALVAPTNPLNEADLVPLDSPAAPGVPTPGAADVNIHLNMHLNEATFMFEVNGATFTEPPMPVMLQIMSGAQTAQDLLPAGSVYVIPPNSVVELSMTGGQAGQPHPMHLHGHEFSIVRTAGSSSYNYVNPPRRDVASFGTETDNVTIRFTTDNPGPWIFHCHIDWHILLGLSIVFAEDMGTVSNFNPPTSWDNLCPIYDALPPGDKH